MPPTITDLIPVPFLGSTIYVSDEIVPHVPLRPICEALGLDWRSQQRKLNSAKKRWGVVMMTTPSAGGVQQSLAIPLSRLYAWLHSITASKVKPQVRPTLERYHEECDAVLAQHFQRHRMGLPLPPAPGAALAGDMVEAVYGLPKAARDPEAERLAAKVIAARKAGAPFRRQEGDAIKALNALGYEKHDINWLIGKVACDAKRLPAAQQPTLPLFGEG